jgi:hypothetical protein
VTVDLRAASGLDVTLDEEALALAFGSDVVHPARVRRRLADVRATLADPKAVGPEHLYTIYMDIFRAGDHAALIERSLLYGAVVYNHGQVVANPRYAAVADVEVVAPNDLPLLGVPNDLPIYQAWQQSPGLFDFLPKPELVEQAWASL